MGGRKRMGVVGQVTSAVIGLLCALVLGVLFYGSVVYQAFDTGEEEQRLTATPAPLEQDKSAEALFPGALLALGEGKLEEEYAQDIEIGGVVCRVITRSYALEDGRNARAISAYPADYLLRMAQEGYTPQLITGFTLAGMEAAYETRADEGLLAARSADFVYMIESGADETAMYALGAGAYLEE